MIIQLWIFPIVNVVNGFLRHWRPARLRHKFWEPDDTRGTNILGILYAGRISGSHLIFPEQYTCTCFLNRVVLKSYVFGRPVTLHPSVIGCHWPDVEVCDGYSSECTCAIMFYMIYCYFTHKHLFSLSMEVFHDKDHDGSHRVHRSTKRSLSCHPQARPSSSSPFCSFWNGMAKFRRGESEMRAYWKNVSTGIRDDTYANGYVFIFPL